jgi:WD40 repeat protein
VATGELPELGRTELVSLTIKLQRGRASDAASIHIPLLGPLGQIVYVDATNLITIRDIGAKVRWIASSIEDWEKKAQGPTRLAPVEPTRPPLLNDPSGPPPGKLKPSAPVEVQKEVNLVTQPRFQFATKAAGAEKSGVYGIVMTPDGKRVITSNSDGTTKVWNASNGLIERTFQGQDLGRCPLAMTTDGKIVAVAGRDRSINLWQVATGELVRTLRGHGEYVTAMAFSPNGEVLVSGASALDQKNGELWVWDTVHGKVLQKVSTVGKVKSLAFKGPFVQRLYAVMGDGQVTAFEFVHGRDQIGREIRRLPHDGTGRAVAFDPRVDFIGVGYGAEGRVAIWNGETLHDRHPKKTSDWLAHHKPITALAFSRRNLFLTASIDGTAKLWDITNETTIVATFSPAHHGGEIWSAIFTPDDKEFVTAGQDGIVRFWNVPDSAQRP